MVYQSPRPHSLLLILVHFYFSVFDKPVYYKVDESDIPSRSTEKRGHSLGISKHVSCDMTFKVMTDDTQNIIFRYNLSSANEPMESNICLGPLCGEPYPLIKFNPERDKQSMSWVDNYSKP